MTFAVRVGVKEQVALLTQLEDTGGTVSVDVQPTDAAGVWEDRDTGWERRFPEEELAPRQPTLLGLPVSLVIGSGRVAVKQVVAGVAEGGAVAGRADDRGRAAAQVTGGRWGEEEGPDVRPTPEAEAADAHLAKAAGAVPR